MAIAHDLGVTTTPFDLGHDVIDSSLMRLRGVAPGWIDHATTLLGSTASKSTMAENPSEAVSAKPYPVSIGAGSGLFVGPEHFDPLAVLDGDAVMRAMVPVLDVAVQHDGVLTVRLSPSPMRTQCTVAQRSKAGDEL